MERASVWSVLSLFLLMLVAAACGSDEVDGASEDGRDIEATTDEIAEAIENGEEDLALDAVDDLTEELEDNQIEGSASLTVGGQTYSFDGVLCAFGEDETAQVDAEFVMSAVADGTQLYFTIDQFGHKVSLDDVEDFENPSVGWDSRGEEFIQIDGRSASGEADFVDGTTEGQDTVTGTFEAICP